MKTKNLCNCEEYKECGVCTNSHNIEEFMIFKPIPRRAGQNFLNKKSEICLKIINCENIKQLENIKERYDLIYYDLRKQFENKYLTINKIKYMQITTELKSKIKQYQIDTNKGLWDSFDNIDYIDKNYCEVYNNDKGDNRNKFHLTKEQVIRLEELGSIYVNINQKYDK